jgi:hypothetical protein
MSRVLSKKPTELEKPKKDDKPAPVVVLGCDERGAVTLTPHTATLPANALARTYTFNDAPYRPNILTLLALPPLAHKPQHARSGNNTNDNIGNDSNEPLTAKPVTHCDLFRLPSELFRDIVAQLMASARNQPDAPMYRLAVLALMGTCSTVYAVIRPLFQCRILDYLLPLSGVFD